MSSSDDTKNPFNKIEVPPLSKAEQAEIGITTETFPLKSFESLGHEQWLKVNRELARKILGAPMFGSKSGYRREFPDRRPIFNAYLLMQDRDGLLHPVWLGDLELTVCEPLLVVLALEAKTSVYVYREGTVLNSTFNGGPFPYERWTVRVTKQGNYDDREGPQGVEDPGNPELKEPEQAGQRHALEEGQRGGEGRDPLASPEPVRGEQDAIQESLVRPETRRRRGWWLLDLGRKPQGSPTT